MDILIAASFRQPKYFWQGSCASITHTGTFNVSAICMRVVQVTPLCKSARSIWQEQHRFPVWIFFLLESLGNEPVCSFLSSLTWAYFSIPIIETSQVRTLLFSTNSAAYFSSSAYLAFNTFPCSNYPIFPFSLVHSPIRQFPLKHSNSKPLSST